MPEFAEFQLNAKKLADRLSRILTKNQGCILFFKKISPDKQILKDALMISKFACCLENQNDEALIGYLQGLRKESLLTAKELDEFKLNALIGCYLFKWRQYDGLLSNYIYLSAINVFKEHLGVGDLSDIKSEDADKFLNDFSIYCSFVYKKRFSRAKQDQDFVELHEQLGDLIQVEIDAIRYPQNMGTTLVSGLYTGLTRVLGV
jgi:hypothetical protein